jgi:hypothetical protein
MSPRVWNFEARLCSLFRWRKIPLWGDLRDGDPRIRLICLRKQKVPFYGEVCPLNV